MVVKEVREMFYTRREKKISLILDRGIYLLFNWG